MKYDQTLSKQVVVATENAVEAEEEVMVIVEGVDLDSAAVKGALLGFSYKLMQV